MRYLFTIIFILLTQLINAQSSYKYIESSDVKSDFDYLYKALQETHYKVKMTSEKGNYQFKGIPDGKCMLTFTLEYYDTVVKEIAVYSDKATKLDVMMKKTEK